MKLHELKQAKPGTYAAVQFGVDTIDALQEYITQNQIPNGIAKTKMHCTLLFSRKHLPNYEPIGDIEPPLEGKPTKLEVWPSRPNENGETANCLVLNFDCPDLTKRHKELMNEHKAQFDFDEYKTHVTLSYDIGDMKIDELPKGTDIVDKIDIVKEYGRDLDLKWAEKSTS